MINRRCGGVSSGWQHKLSLCCVLFAAGRSALAGDQDLTSLSLEELMNVEVVSVSRKAERLGDAAAAVFVITDDDIRRSGATSIADALRLAPGLNVARASASQWAITARGLNYVLADRLLVLIDGRTVFTPLFSGVYWDIQDYPMEDIARIEVIRGPGGTMWGANAVNGVINIITKRADETQGVLVSTTTGTVEPYVAALRYGGQFANGTSYRGYVKGRKVDDFDLPDGSSAGDAAELLRAGFRVDGARAGVSWSVLGDVYSGRNDSVVPVPTFAPPSVVLTPLTTDLHGGDVLIRAGHDEGTEGNWTAQFYADRNQRDEPRFKSRVDTIDLDLQQRLTWRSRNELVWGLGVRQIDAQTSGSFKIAMTPDGYSLTQYSLFAQNETRSADDRWRVIAGTKFEHFESSGWQMQPSLRSVWHPASAQTLWGAVSSAVHTPSIGQLSVEINSWIDPNGAPPVLGSLRGSQAVDPERAVARELGYRWQPDARLALSASLSFTRYKNMITTELGSPQLKTSPFFYVEVPVTVINSGSGTVRAFELEADAQLTRAWRLRSTYSYVRPRTPLENSGLSDDPRHQFVVRSSIAIGARVDADLTLRHVSKLHLLGIDSYTGVDVRLAFKQSERFEIAIAGHDLLDAQHPEFADRLIDIPVTDVPRSLSLSAVWKPR